MPRDPNLTREPTPAKRRKMAQPLVLDFTDVPTPPKHFHGKNRELKMTPKQIRARARRKGRMTKAEYDVLYKPVEEWDEEELARGRPRNRAGDFRGAPPQWLTREVHEAAVSRFKQIIQMDVRAEGPVALGVIRNIMGDNSLDNRGRYRTPPSTRLAAAQLMLEHSIGKPVQHVEQDISVRLQAVLATAMVGPGAIHSDEDMQRIAQEQYEKAYGELTSGSVTQPSTEDPYYADTSTILDAEVVDDDDE